MDKDIVFKNGLKWKRYWKEVNGNLVPKWEIVLNGSLRNVAHTR